MGARRQRLTTVSAAALIALGTLVSGCTFKGVSSMPLPGGVDTGKHPYEVKMVFENVLDLGCGNGAVGCLAGGKAGPAGGVTFIDSSLRAISLAELNAKANNTPNPKFLAATRLEGLAPNSFDVILANPPYYAKSEITALFVEGTRDLLKPGGRYYIVTKMPTAVVPMIFETYGDCSVIENRGYSVVMAGA